MRRSAGPGRALAAHPLIVAVLFEAALIPLALGLALLLNIAPWTGITLSAATLLRAVAATAALTAALALLAAVAPAWFRELDALIRPLVGMLFRGRGIGAIVLVSALAGVGEELLFRGVLQAWLAGLAGPWAGLAMAAVLFGLAHYLSRSYFLVATGMGLYLGLLYQLTGNLLLPALVHALYDAGAIVYLLHGPAPGADEPHP